MAARKSPAKAAQAQVAEVMETIESNVTELFPMTTADVPEAFRDMAEKSVAQARDSYAKMKSAAEDATDLLEETFETARTNSMDLSTVSIDAMKANLDASFAFMKDFMAVKSVSEAVELQTAFARERFDATTAQAKDMQAKLTKMTEEASKPVKDAMAKSMDAFKAA
ncbi:MAG: phasin [Devosiaceae bacterium]|nr:phasin [Devosiaceae bacterium MH13]